MPTEFLKLKVNDFGQVILPASDPEGRKAFFVEFFQTPIGKRFASFEVTYETENRISEIMEKRFGDHEVTLDQFCAMVEQLIAVRDPAVVPPEEPEPVAVAADRPRDGQGRFLSEFEIWASDPSRSMKAIRSRAQEDPDGFGAWFRYQTVAQTLQPGSLVIAGAPTRPATQADISVGSLLNDFLKAYHAASADRLKPRGGRITLDATHSYLPADFERLLSQASQAGLL
jgi:hypothetical protein